MVAMRLSVVDYVSAEFGTERSVPCGYCRSSGGGPLADAPHDQPWPYLTEA